MCRCGWFIACCEASVSSATANANIPAGIKTESFLWDGLALIRRNTTTFMNEPHVTGGNPILASGRPILEDMLGNSLGTLISDDDFSSLKRTAFGNKISTDNPDNSTDTDFFTGKPEVDGLGYAFLFRNYRPDKGKWGTSDPLSYIDGLNTFTYCRNGVTESIDLFGAFQLPNSTPDSSEEKLRYIMLALALAGSEGNSDAQALFNLIAKKNVDTTSQILANALGE